MLLDCHDLDGVVAELADAGQHLVLEFKVGVDLGLVAAHAHVALVDAQAPRPVQRAPAERQRKGTAVRHGKC